MNYKYPLNENAMKRLEKLMDNLDYTNGNVRIEFEKGQGKTVSDKFLKQLGDVIMIAQQIRAQTLGNTPEFAQGILKEINHITQLNYLSNVKVEVNPDNMRNIIVRWNYSSKLSPNEMTLERFKAAIKAQGFNKYVSFTYLQS